MSGGNNQGEPAVMLFVIIGLVCILGWLFWHQTNQFWMNYFFRWLRFVEIWIVNLGSHKYDACLDWLRYAQLQGAPTPSVIGFTNQCFGSYMSEAPRDTLGSYYSLTMPPLIYLGAVATHYYRWPAIVFLLVIGSYELFFSPRHKFVTKHTLETLISTQAKMWPILSPIVKFNPANTGRILGEAVPDKLPLFAEALSPEEWITFNRIPVVNGIPDREAARRAFIRQLGPRWTGVDALPIHMKALVAAYALKGMQKREDSDDLLGRISLAWSPQKGFRPDSSLVSEIKGILRNPELGGKIIPIADKHAYRTTAMLSMLLWARSNGGVLAPAQFLWLRAEDRALWYPLNNLGRRSYHSEGAGAMGHFMAEQAAQKPLPIPRVDTAVVTLNTYLHDPDKRPIPIPPREGAKA